MTITHTRIEYRAGELDCEGVLLHDPMLHRQCGIVLYPNALGISASTVVTAEEAAARGYVVFVADMYGKATRPQTLEQGSPLARGLRGDQALWRERVSAAFDVLRERVEVDSSKLGAIGFCFGGSCALELARSGAAVRGVVSFHGGLATANAADARNIRGSVLVLHGADDPFVPPADVRAFEEEMRGAKIDWQLVEFGGAHHSFADKGANMPGKAMYDARVSRRAFKLMDDFFAEMFGD